MNRTPLSLRDPAGRVLISDGRVIRFVFPAGKQNAAAALASPGVRRFQDEGRFVRTWQVPNGDDVGSGVVPIPVSILEHELIEFPSFPVEWTARMLQAAGMLTLEIATELLREGRGLKDATPLNILFRGSQPVFIDALSVEQRDAGDPTWAAYGQFVRTFLLPLVAARHLGWSMRRTFTGARDGLTPEEVYPHLGWPARLAKPARAHVTGPVLLHKMMSGKESLLPRRLDPPAAAFVLRSLFTRLEEALEKVTPAARTSKWAFYRAPVVHDPEYHAQRETIVAAILDANRPRTVLDVGCNDGRFALLAASRGADVVAIDRDESVVDHLSRSRERGVERILPLVVDLADPTAGSGWRNSERPSFLDRAIRSFEAVFALAVVHHLVLGDFLPLPEVLNLFAELATRLLIIEFVPPTDPKALAIAAGRPINPSRWSEAVFERELSDRFEIVSRHSVGAHGRLLFEVRPKRTW